MITQGELSYLEILVRQAGNELLKYWPGNQKHNDLDQLNITKKEDGSSVTSADFASNKILIEGLKKYFSGSSIISEETPNSNPVTTDQMLWIIDPLDGTKAFIEGRDDFSILIGLAFNSIIKVGIMYFPARNLLAYATKGHGSTIAGKKGEVSKSNAFRPRSIYYRNCSLKAEEALFSEPMDSGMAFLALAKGDIDGIIIHMTTHREWDIAAPLVVIEESGGKVSDQNGQPIEFKNGRISCKYVVASNNLLHNQLLNMIP